MKPRPCRSPTRSTRRSASTTSRTRCSASSSSAGTAEGCCPGSTRSRTRRTTIASARTSSLSQKHGFERPLLFTNEEATDFVHRTGESWHLPTVLPTEPGAEQAGVVVAYDVRTGQYKSIYGMGRHNHENSVALAELRPPGRSLRRRHLHRPVVAALHVPRCRTPTRSGTTRATLWAFQSRTTRRRTTTATSSGSESIVRASSSASRSTIAKGDQTALENWSNANNVFQFIRVEDIAYDRDEPQRRLLRGHRRAAGAAEPGDGSAPARARRDHGPVAERPDLQDGARP